MLSSLHKKYIFGGRVNKLVGAVANVIPSNVSVLDIGCGSGDISSKLAQENNLDLIGVDVLVRESCKISVKKFDGEILPFSNNSFDYCLFVDVLHHVDNISTLLKEARRVARMGIIIKDHKYTTKIQYQKLVFMDWVGNEYIGVRLPYNYLTWKQWVEVFKDLNLEIKKSFLGLDLYPIPISLIFPGSLHFLVELRIDETNR